MSSTTSTILTTILTKFISVLLSSISGDQLKRFADYLLDKIEEYVEETETGLDNMALLPMCTLVRSVFSIDEYEDGTDDEDAIA